MAPKRQRQASDYDDEGADFCLQVKRRATQEEGGHRDDDQNPSHDHVELYLHEQDTELPAFSEEEEDYLQSLHEEEEGDNDDSDTAFSQVIDEEEEVDDEDEVEFREQEKEEEEEEEKEEILMEIVGEEVEEVVFLEREEEEDDDDDDDEEELRSLEELQETEARKCINSIIGSPLVYVPRKFGPGRCLRPRKL